MSVPLPEQPKPTGIVVDLPARMLEIKWRDGVVSQYSFDVLRRACPCAECRPWVHGLGQVGETPAEGFPAGGKPSATGDLNTLQDIQPVGSYALHFNWADGHTYGIYDWKYLRALADTLTLTARQEL